MDFFAPWNLRIPSPSETARRNCKVKSNLKTITSSVKLLLNGLKESRVAPVMSKKCRHFILNSKGTPYCDGFCGLDTKGGRKREWGSSASNVTQDMFNEERKKAASGNDFSFYLSLPPKTPRDPKIELPNLPRIVHAGNWKDYFGPFSGNIKLPTRFCSEWV